MVLIKNAPLDSLTSILNLIKVFYDFKKDS